MQKPVEKRTITRIFICTLLFSLYHIADFSIDLPELTFWNFTNVLKLATSAEGGYSLQFMLPVSCHSFHHKVSPHAACEFILCRWY